MSSLQYLPYTATSISVCGRFIFMYLIYRNKSTNSLSLLFCGLSIASSSMWIYYSVQNNDLPMIVRSSTEISLLAISRTTDGCSTCICPPSGRANIAIYIIRNKIADYEHNNRVLPISEFQIQQH
jgi:uncharacterized protein with PQ loop repeat